MLIRYHFYPRSPCGERRPTGRPVGVIILFLSTLSLRRATAADMSAKRETRISIHALLAESDFRQRKTGSVINISIHALLAESDASSTVIVILIKNFYPRSPCGERRRHRGNDGRPIYFYPRSPCGERQARRASRQQPAGISIHALLAESDLQELIRVVKPSHNFYPRSPCGERRSQTRTTAQTTKFLSTLSLRRATSSVQCRL